MFSEMFGGAQADRARLQATPVSLAEEQRLGQQLLRQALGEFKRQKVGVSQHSKHARYAQALADHLHANMQNRRRYRKIDVYVVESDITDARAIPGGAILISRGMFDFAPSEAAIAGVVAHELSHIDRGHLLEGIKSQKLAQQGFAGRQSPADMMQATRLMVSQFARPFRPEQEVEADQDAARWLLAAEYDPEQMAELFFRMHERDRQKQQAQAFLPSFLRSHPYHLDRRQAVLQLAGEHQDRQHRYIGRRNLRELRPRTEKEYANEFAR